MLRRLLFRLIIAAVAFVVALSGFALAIAFLFVAAYDALALVVPPWGAALIIAGAAILFSIVMLLLARKSFRLAPPKKKRTRETEGLESIFASLLGDNARSFAEKNAFMASAVALLAGFVSGLSPRLRELVLKFLAV